MDMIVAEEVPYLTDGGRQRMSCGSREHHPGSGARDLIHRSRIKTAARAWSPDIPVIFLPARSRMSGCQVGGVDRLSSALYGDDRVAAGYATGLSRARLRHLDAIIRWHYDVHVRTTLTLDPDVAQLVDEAVHRARTSMKQVINDALRRALSQPPSRREPYHLPVHEAALQPGLDLAGFNRLADELEDEAILATGKRPGS